MKNWLIIGAIKVNTKSSKKLIAYYTFLGYDVTTITSSGHMTSSIM